MLQEVNNSIRMNMADIKPTINIAVDTGKALTKFCYKTDDGTEKLGKFPSAIGMADGDASYNKTKPFYCGPFQKSYFIDAPGLCNITTTDDNAKNGEGRSVGEQNNHDKEIVAVGTCLAICKAMKDYKANNALIHIALGMPISEYFKTSNKRMYFETILPLDTLIKCVYDGEEYDFTITEFVVCPETFSAFLFNGGKEKGNMILVDIGGNNKQFIRYGDGAVSTDENLTFTDKGGVNDFIAKLITLMKSAELVKSATFAEVQDWLMCPKKIPYNDEWRDAFNKLVSNEKIKYFNSIHAEFDPVNGRYKDEIARGYKVYYTGGGAEFLKDEIKATENASLFPGGEYANVKGFYSFLG